MVLENASCFVDERGARSTPQPRIDAKAVEEVERLFFGEKPPNGIEGTSSPRHDKVGIGMVQPRATATEVPALRRRRSSSTHAACTQAARPDAWALRSVVEERSPPPRRSRASVCYDPTLPSPSTWPSSTGTSLVRHTGALPVAWPAGYETPIVLQTAAWKPRSTSWSATAANAACTSWSMGAKVPTASELVMVSLADDPGALTDEGPRRNRSRVASDRTVRPRRSAYAEEPTEPCFASQRGGSRARRRATPTTLSQGRRARPRSTAGKARTRKATQGYESPRHVAKQSRRD